MASFISLVDPSEWWSSIRGGYRYNNNTTSRGNVTSTIGTENGHCSTCQVQNSLTACGASAQAFRTIVGSSQVDQHEKYLKLNLDQNIGKIQAQETIVTADVWKQVQDILQWLKDYGQIAEINPTQDKINAVHAEKDNIIQLEDYNVILNALDHGDIKSQQLITKDLIDSLKTYIKTYNLDAARCDVCNASGCQVAQCCDNLCCDHQGGGGGGGGGGPVDDPCYGNGIYYQSEHGATYYNEDTGSAYYEPY